MTGEMTFYSLNQGHNIFLTLAVFLSIMCLIEHVRDRHLAYEHPVLRQRVDDGRRDPVCPAVQRRVRAEYARGQEPLLPVLSRSPLDPHGPGTPVRSIEHRAHFAASI